LGVIIRLLLSLAISYLVERLQIVRIFVFRSRSLSHVVCSRRFQVSCGVVHGVMRHYLTSEGFNVLMSAHNNNIRFISPHRQPMLKARLQYERTHVFWSCHICLYSCNAQAVCLRTACHGPSAFTPLPTLKLIQHTTAATTISPELTHISNDDMIQRRQERGFSSPCSSPQAKEMMKKKEEFASARGSAIRATLCQET